MTFLVVCNACGAQRESRYRESAEDWTEVQIGSLYHHQESTEHVEVGCSEPCVRAILTRLAATWEKGQDEGTNA